MTDFDSIYAEIQQLYLKHHPTGQIWEREDALPTLLMFVKNRIEMFEQSIGSCNVPRNIKQTRKALLEVMLMGFITAKKMEENV